MYLDQGFRGDDGAPATTELREATEAWINISGRESLNLLHHHSDSTWSGVYYVDDGRGGEEGHLGGQLLLRLTPGGGSGGDEPHEMYHVPRMAFCGMEHEPGSPVHKYMEIQPIPGSLIIFPGFLSHAVAPHFGAAERISVSFNIFLEANESKEDTEATGAPPSDSSSDSGY